MNSIPPRPSARTDVAPEVLLHTLNPFWNVLSQVWRTVWSAVPAQLWLQPPRGGPTVLVANRGVSKIKV